MSVTASRSSSNLSKRALARWLASTTLDPLSAGFRARLWPRRTTLPRVRALLGGLTAVLFVMTTASLGFATTAGASPKPSTSAQIYFYEGINNPINLPDMKNPLVVRPLGLALFNDGSWYLKDLHWSGWGSSVASATGTSMSSPCGPACPTSRWTNSPAQFVLSSPGAVLGHEVYRCYQLTIPSFPRSDQHACIGRRMNYYGYFPVSELSATTSTSTATTTKLGSLRTPSGNIDCEYGVGLKNAAEDYVACGVRSGLVPPEPRPTAGCGYDSDYSGNVVSLSGTGAARAVPCQGDCGPLCAPDAAVLQYGQTWDGGPLTCTSTYSGLTCRNKSGHGFFLSRQSWRLF